MPDMDIKAIDIKPIDEFRFCIPRNEAAGMRTDVIVYASAALMQQIQKDQSLTQAMNVATLLGIVGSSLAMPDIHQGYGFPIGGVAATDMDYGVVSPGGVGFDINCGVRLLLTTLTERDVRPRLKQLIDQVFRDVPCGTGTEGRVKIKRSQLDDVLRQGSRWMVQNGYGEALSSPKPAAPWKALSPTRFPIAPKNAALRNLAPSAAATTSSKFNTSNRFTMLMPLVPCISKSARW